MSEGGLLPSVRLDRLDGSASARLVRIYRFTAKLSVIHQTTSLNPNWWISLQSGEKSINSLACTFHQNADKCVKCFLSSIIYELFLSHRKLTWLSPHIHRAAFSWRCSLLSFDRPLTPLFLLIPSHGSEDRKGILWITYRLARPVARRQWSGDD